MLKSPAFWIVAILLLGIGFYFYGSAGEEIAAPNANNPARIQCVVGGPDPYWKKVIAGATDAAKEFDAKLSVLVPESTDTAVTTQNDALSAISATKFDGLMISPLDPAKHTRLISAATAEVHVVTFDSQLPAALTHYHVGANNHDGGRLLAQLVQRALPEGGKFAIFAGDNTRQTARIRRQLLVNALRGNDRAEGTSVSDNLDQPIEAGKYTLVGTYLDNRNFDQAVQNARRALEDHPDLECMVGLYSKNGPACAAAVDEAGKSSEVKIVAFDDLDDTLQGIRDGKIVGAVVQDPYQYGYESVRLLSRLHKSDELALPFRFSGNLAIGCQIVDKDNVDQYVSEQAKQIAN